MRGGDLRSFSQDFRSLTAILQFQLSEDIPSSKCSREGDCRTLVHINNCTLVVGKGHCRRRADDDGAPGICRGFSGRHVPTAAGTIESELLYEIRGIQLICVNYEAPKLPPDE